MRTYECYIIGDEQSHYSETGNIYIYIFFLNEERKEHLTERCKHLQD